ncbi:related to transcriptional activator acu-15 [Melanopsichium pennsylvanicum]|uniref:Related to transcriptional activator acu-15 n=2 Tax=Melanopsichium pennsylvanicum TaxID=63383 RepID=A0AAJ5C2C4_9BASI|nr:related to transcriptional activator acu-15 [Melanopsichium pennsylvanicum 4]SNX81420.1 related to transcriptional activator acu-15 [Melanopsichium pennsylvanicum]
MQYNQAMIPPSMAQQAESMYNQHILASTSNYSEMPMHTMPQQQGTPSSYSNNDMSGHAADTSIDTTNHDDDENAGKRRRVQRACDTCRKKKVRCDGLQPEKGACSNCANYGYECTFVDAARKRAPPRSYVEAIEARIVKMEQLIASLAPGVDFTDRIGKPIRRPDEKGDEGNNDMHAGPESTPAKLNIPLAAISLDRANSLCGHSGALSQMLSPSHVKSHNNSESEINTADEDSEDDIAFIESRFGDVNVNPRPYVASATRATFDSSQTERIILGDHKKVSSTSSTAPTHKFIGKASAMHSLPLLERLSSKDIADLGLNPKEARPEYWTVPSGFIDPPGDPANVSSVWPENDLAEKLIDAYFGRMNRDFPVVNEAQYRHEYIKRPELRQDPEWLALSFCIFMVGSLYVFDDRVRAVADDAHSRGMHWWQAAKLLVYRNYRVAKPLVQVQCMLLSTIFQLGLPIAASLAWLHLGGAIRVLLDIGAHRKQAAKKLRMSRIDQETSKRIFWVAYSLDREFASNLGRPIMLQDEDIDVELPIEIDDDLLFNTPDDQPLPKQPADKPALIYGFLCSLRLDEIVGRTLKTVYALHKTKVRFGIASKEWDERLVTEIDSALNNWLDTVPSHLRYDPHETNDEWLMQSSLLYSKYYNCQLLVHRPFIPVKKSANENSILNFPSLAICTNAARSISHLLQSLKDRDLQIQGGILVAFRSVSASSILLMVVWGAKRSGGRVSSSASTDLRRSIDVLQSMETHWQFCGKAVDFLESLMASTHVLVPRSFSQTEQGTKRSRDSQASEDVRVEHEVSAAQPSNNAARNEVNDPPGKAKSELHGEAIVAHSGSANGQPLAPEARQLPLSTLQLASMTPQSTEQSPSSAGNNECTAAAQTEAVNNQAMFGDPFWLSTPRPVPRGRVSSVSFASGIAAPLSFGLMTPSASHWGSSGDGSDYLQGPLSQMSNYQSVPAVTPSMFDNLRLSGGSDEFMPANIGGTSDMSQFGFMPNPGAGPGVNGDVFSGLDQYFAGQNQANPANGEGHGQSSHANTPQSDGSNGLASYAFELLQKESVWNLDDESLSFLQQRGQRR